MAVFEHRSRRYHRVAMEYVGSALVAKHEGELETAKCYYYQAYKCEKAAIRHLADDPLTCAVFHRSAACMALQAGEPAKAMELACAGLALEGVPGEIIKELEEVLKGAEGGKE